MIYFKTILGEDLLFLKQQSSPRARTYSLLSEKMVAGFGEVDVTIYWLWRWTRGERAEEATVPHQPLPPFGGPGS